MDRLAELAGYAQSFPSMVDDDFIAAGFTPEEISSYRSQTAPQPISQADRSAILNEYGTFQQPDYTLRERTVQGSQDILSNTFGMDPYNAGVLSRNVLGDPNSSGSNYGMGIADFTPLGAAFAAQEGSRTASSGYEAGDPVQMGLGGLEVLLGVAEGVPIAGRAVKPLSKAVINTVEEVFDTPFGGEVLGYLRGVRDLDADFLRGRGDPALAQGVGADVPGRAPLTFDEVEAAMREETPAKPTAAEMRRQANIQRFGYDPSEVVERTPTDNAGFEAYLERVNPGMKRIAETDRPNLMMGDMYGMKPKGSEVVGSKGDVTFHRSPDGEYYATAFNPDVNEEDVIGYITDRGDGTELAVVGEMQGQGVGGELQYLFRSENPNAPTGGLTEAGEGSLRRTYERLADEGIIGDDVPFGGASAPEVSLRVSDPTQTGWTFKDVDRSLKTSKSENRRISNDTSRIEDVPINQLYATQPSVNPDFATTSSSAGEVPLVVRKGGKMFVQDGHHRLTKQAESGSQTAKVRFIDLDNADTSTPLLDWSKEKTQFVEADQDLLDELFSQ